MIPRPSHQQPRTTPGAAGARSNPPN
jgi:hypothetical protein